MQQKIYILLSLVLTITYAYAQTEDTYDLEKVESDRSYYNFIETKNTLYIGTSVGAVLINKNNETSIQKELIGYLSLENEKVISKGIYFGHIIDVNEEKKFNYLLPNPYKELVSRHILFNNKLYLINSNKLFIFGKRNYSFTHDSLSVRSITPHYIGSYSGIYKNGSKLPFPTYTDGFIREFQNETFICYEGLFRDSAGIISNYSNPENKLVKIGNIEIGAARDILKIENNQYILLTTTGIYLVNFSQKKIETIYKATKNDEKISFIKCETVNNMTTRLFYSAQEKINYYVFQTKETITLLSLKNAQIQQAYFPNTIDKIYVLLNNRFSECILNTRTNQYTENILIPELRLPHNFLINNHYAFISTNEGLHMYYLKSNSFYSNIIPFETNNLSLSLVNDTIKVGTVNGIANLSIDNINNIVKEYIDKSTISTKVDKNNSFIYLILIQSCAIIALILLIFKLKKKTPIAKPESLTQLPTKENIISYINRNIISVSNKSICDHFNINAVKLYEILEDEKPGEIIRNLRVALVRKYRKEKKDEQFISENTGFSISYLKKVY